MGKVTRKPPGTAYEAGLSSWQYYLVAGASMMVLSIHLTAWGCCYANFREDTRRE